MMTQKPSSWMAKWKYSGVLPILLLALLVFSFRPKESDDSMKSDPIHAMGIDGNTEQPIFPGCEKLNLMEIADCSKKKLYEYVADHLKYPDELKEAKIEGKVYVKFVITKNGLVANARVPYSLHPAADSAALDVVNSMNENVGKWTPGTKEGIPVDMDMVLPFSFVLGTETENQPEDVYTYVEKMPTFPDGQEAMYQFIYNNLKYPQLAKQKKVSGTVYIQFVVSKDGEIKDAIVKRGIGSGCDEEALRVVNSMPKWNPGIHKGKFVPVTFTLPIKFVMQ